MSSRLTAPRFWLLTIATVAAVSVALALGAWQLSRAAEKQTLQALIDQRENLEPLDARAFAAADGAALLHRLVRLRGHWLHQHTVFLDNRQMNARPGFFVLTPLQLENAATVVLVQRGWAPRSFVDRAQLPMLPRTTGLVDVTGRIVPPPSKLFEFGDSGAGQIRQNLDLPGFSREIGLPMAATTVLELGRAGDGLERDWPKVATGVHKHYGYAFQWFALAGLIVFLYGWFQIFRRRVPPR